jgi:hypothetical protein
MVAYYLGIMDRIQMSWISSVILAETVVMMAQVRDCDNQAIFALPTAALSYVESLELPREST